MSLVFYFGVSFVLALCLTPICRAVARRYGLTAAPKDDRWHQTPTALVGGVAIALPTLLLGTTLPLGEIWQLLVCGGLIAAFGFADDLRTLKPSTKLIAQIVLASALVFFGHRLEWTSSLTGDLMLTLFWIVGITNAFNLLDNMDGLCAGTALVAGGFTLLGMAGDPTAATEALYLAALLGATAGFLVYNLHPASIFMGDTGSLFLGLNLAAITLFAGAHSGGGARPRFAAFAPALLLLVPILDTTLVTAARILSGRRPSQGGRDHTSHRLVAIGLSQRWAVLVLWLLAAASGTAAVALKAFDSNFVVIATATLLLAATIFGVYLASVRVYSHEHLLRLREGSVTPLVVEFVNRRHVAEVLLDLFLVSLAYYTAYHLRFEPARLTANFQLFLQSLPIVVAVQILALFLVGGYRGHWHLFGMMDAMVFVRGILLGAIGSQVVLLYLYRFESYSRIVFVLYSGVLLLLLCGSRASFRLLEEFVQRRRSIGERCVVYGTGTASLATIREAFGDRPLRILGFVDDDPQQRRMRLSGYAVLGDFAVLLRMIEKEEVDCVVLNTRILDVDRLLGLEAACQERGVSLLRLHINVQPFIAAS